MRDEKIEKEMYKIAKDFIEKRYPVGWGGAAVIHTEQEHYLISVSIETANASANIRALRLRISDVHMTRLYLYHQAHSYLLTLHDLSVIIAKKMFL